MDRIETSIHSFMDNIGLIKIRVNPEQSFERFRLPTNIIVWEKRSLTKKKKEIV